MKDIIKFIISESELIFSSALFNAQAKGSASLLAVLLGFFFLLFLILIS